MFFDSNLILASLSLGGVLLVSEAERLPVFSYSTYQHDPNLLTTLFLALFFGVLLVGKYFKPSTKRTPPALIIALALALSGAVLGILTPAGYLAPWVSFLCDVIHSMLWPVFLYAWIREMLPLGYSYTIQSFALGLIVVGILNFLSMAMNTLVSIVVITLLPLLSGILLLKVKTPEHAYASEVSFGQSGKRTTKQYLQFFFFCIIPLVCFTVVFGNVHLSWNTLQDGSGMSLIVQLGVATGTLVAGISVYGLYAIGTLRKYNSIVMLILVAFTLFSIWLSTYTNGSLVFLYAAFLNIAQKGTFLLIFLAPFRGPWRDPLFGWCASMCAFLYGTFISSIVMSFNAEMVLVAFAVIALCLLMVSAVAMLVNDIEGSKFSQAGSNRTISAPQSSEMNDTTSADPHQTELTMSPSSHELYEDRKKDTSSSSAPSYAAKPTEYANETSENASARAHETIGSKTSSDQLDQAVTPPSPTETDAISTAMPQSSTPLHSKDEEYVAYMRLVQEFALTRREADVLSLAIHGRTAEPIAKTLGISPATAKTHLRNIYNKLGIHTQQEVIDLMEAYLHR